MSGEIRSGKWPIAARDVTETIPAVGKARGVTWLILIYQLSERIGPCGGLGSFNAAVAFGTSEWPVLHPV